MIICQCYAVLAVRNHYSADVILAFIFTPMFFHWYDNWRIFDIQPRKIDVKTEHGGDRRKKAIIIRRTTIDYFRSRSLFHTVYAAGQVGFVFYMMERGLARVRDDK